jgi:hypothetical protein
MPSPEIVNTAESSFAEISQTTVQQIHSKKNYFENYLKSIVLLMAVYALIINRAMEAKKFSRQPEPPPMETKPAYTKADVEVSKTKPQNSVMFNAGMPVIFSSNYLIWK